MEYEQALKTKMEHLILPVTFIKYIWITEYFYYLN